MRNILMALLVLGALSACATQPASTPVEHAEPPAPPEPETEATPAPDQPPPPEPPEPEPTDGPAKPQ